MSEDTTLGVVGATMEDEDNKQAPNETGSSSKTEKKKQTLQEVYESQCKKYDRQPSGFLGLENQGATCYLNSIVQNLYMTPEFRSTVFKLTADDLNYQDEKSSMIKEEKLPEPELSYQQYQDMGFNKNAINAAFEKKGRRLSKNNDVMNWLLDNGFNYPDLSEEEKKAEEEELKKAEEEKKKKEKKPKIIPIQIQKLFTNLLHLNKPWTSTEELTKAFGWKSSHVYFEQHDVQELTRVLFDVFGKSIKKTEHKDILDTLFRGKTVNKIKCLTCGYTSERIEEFIDIPLFLKDMVTQTQYNNIYESLRKYLEEEDLVGDIQYACDTCAKKVDAKKTIFIRNLPPLLMFSVNRFDYDWQRGIRTKINQRFDFPEELDLSEFVEKNETNSQLGKDELIYELTGVVIHVGSAHKGHYHAYIKDLLGEGKCKIGQFSGKPTEESYQWYDFNDKYVSPITKTDLEKQYGGIEGQDESAYMLFYRRKNMKPYEKLCDALTTIPKHLQQSIDDEKEKVKKEKERLEYEETIYQVHVYIPEFFVCHEEYLRPQNYDFQHDGGDTYQKVDGPKDMKLKDFYEEIRKKFKKDALPKNFQLYYMDRQQMMMSADRYKVNCVMSGEDDVSLRKTKYITNKIHVLAANPTSLQKIQLARGKDSYMSLRIYVFDSPNEPPQHSVTFTPISTWKKFRSAIEDFTKVKVDKQKIFKLRWNRRPIEVTEEDPDTPLFALSAMENAAISVEDKTLKGNEKVPFVIQQYENEKSEISLHVTDKITDATLFDDKKSTWTSKCKITWTIAELKVHCLKEIQEYHKFKEMVDPKTCYFRRSYRNGLGDPIEDETPTLEDAKIENYDSLVIEQKFLDKEVTIKLVEHVYGYSKKSEIWEFKFDRQSSIRDVKTKLMEVASKKCISVHHFILREDSNWHNMPGSTIDDEDVTLFSLNLRNGNKLWVELDEAPRKEKIGVKVYALTWPPKESKSICNPKMTSFESWKMVSEYFTFEELQKKILGIYEFRKAKGAKYVRTRYLVKDSQGFFRPFQILSTSFFKTTLKDLKFYDDIEVGVQVFDEEIEDQVDDKKESKDDLYPIYLCIRQRIPSKQIYSKGIEIKFDKNSLSSLKEFKNEISKYFKIEQDKMLLNRFYYSSKAFVTMIENEDGKEEEKTLKEKYELNDGDIIVLTNTDDDPKNEDLFYTKVEIPEEESRSSSGTVTVGGTTYTIRRRTPSPEKQLTIQYDEDESPKTPKDQKQFEK